MDALSVAIALVPTVSIALTTRSVLRRRCFAIDLAIVILGTVGAAWLKATGTAIDGSAAAYVLLMARMAAWVLAAIRAEAELVLWTPVRIALVALLFHSVTLPRVVSVPIDGDEPYYVLMAESLATDGDLDLRNQYDTLERSVVGRTDLRPQAGDPVTSSGAQRSRHEPFFALLLVPGLWAGGLMGASLTVVGFAALLGWSTVRLLRECGFENGSVVAGSTLVLFTAPLVSYSVRIWPEVPAAFFLSEGLRLLLRTSWFRGAVMLGLMSLLKLRFALIAAPLIVAMAWPSLTSRGRRWFALLSLLVLAIPMTIVWIYSGSPLNVHRLDELLLLTPDAIARGMLGMLLDGQSGLLFVCPILFLSIFALVRHGATWPRAWTMYLCIAPYLVLLSSRAEWHGGWSPPLRYLVVFAPIAALGVARMMQLWSGSLVTLAWIGSFAVAASAIAFPWRQFHIANGESVLGELLSSTWRTDYSRFFPSYIRINDAALWGAIILVLALIAVRLVRSSPSVPARVAMPLLAISIAAFAWGGRTPSDVVHFEDAHVTKRGGALDPHHYTVARFLYEGGWRMSVNEGVSFLYGAGKGVLRYRSSAGAIIEVDGERNTLAATAGWRDRMINFADGARHSIQVIEGELVVESLRAR